MSQPVKKEYVVSARDQFGIAQRALVMAAKALEASGGDFKDTIREIKESIGDLAIASEILDDSL